MDRTCQKQKDSRKWEEAHVNLQPDSFAPAHLFESIDFTAAPQYTVSADEEESDAKKLLDFTGNLPLAVTLIAQVTACDGYVENLVLEVRLLLNIIYKHILNTLATVNNVGLELITSFENKAGEHARME
ncbi:hypothetical protein B0H13DRAFT_1871233 [Mycena leptocephala]|nr:hypothetical protein B0H13DRAFT_1871233 [Mycena leptocephala]